MYENLNDNCTDAGIKAEGLGKRFGDFTALEDLDLVVPKGSVLGLLGHNGAGKTTTIRILTTLSVPSTGSATVAGYDVVKQGGEVRKRIGVAGQSATVDGLLTGRANLEMVGRLYGMSKREAAERADELLTRLGLTDAADKLVKEYSGGMRRRADLAATLVSTPPVLFLDEPTTGLDPASRNDLWDVLREQVSEGVTLLLTTQYLEEADRLADEIVVLDHGKVAAAGSPDQLKQRVGGDRIEITLADPADAGPAAEALAGFAENEVHSDPAASLVTAPVRAGTRLVEVVRSLDAAGIDVTDVHRRDATLDDVFLSITSAPKVEVHS
ncbi:MAG: ATP-binding cassette domain-containing protein [Solirubrobacterales bacterium]|nr:ATP-binding cassette domain-containing protein [Solirubrobacterales bacterium]MCB8916251.1 ATP-binding cassette domain-containing protein [Thermoleophilales bacterium]